MGDEIHQLKELVDVTMAEHYKSGLYTLKFIFRTMCWTTLRALETVKCWISCVSRCSTCTSD